MNTALSSTPAIWVSSPEFPEMGELLLAVADAHDIERTILFRVDNLVDSTTDRIRIIVV